MLKSLLNNKINKNEIFFKIFFFTALLFFIGCNSEPSYEELVNKLNDKNERLRVYYAGKLLKLGDKRAVEPFIVALKDPDPNLRDDIALYLGLLGDKRAVEPLIEALKDPSASVRAKATEALGILGDKRAVEPLIEALKDPNYYVKGKAVNALGKLGDKRAVEPLIETLKDPNETSRAVDALQNIQGGDTAYENLVSMLKDPNPSIRGGAAVKLCALGEWRAIDRLIDALEDKNMEVRKKVAFGLTIKLGWKPKSPEESVRLYIANGHVFDLGRSMWSDTKKILLSDIASGNKDKIQTALYTFIRIGKEEIVPDLVSILNKKGTKEIAEVYLNCGHKELSIAAKKWASRNGYQIGTNSYGGPTAPRWGRNQ